MKPSEKTKPLQPPLSLEGVLGRLVQSSLGRAKCTCSNLHGRGDGLVSLLISFVILCTFDNLPLDMLHQRCSWHRSIPFLVHEGYALEEDRTIPMMITSTVC